MYIMFDDPNLNFRPQLLEGSPYALGHPNELLLAALLCIVACIELDSYQFSKQREGRGKKKCRLSGLFQRQERVEGNDGKNSCKKDDDADMRRIKFYTRRV